MPCVPLLYRGDALWRERDWYFNGHRDRIRGAHEALERIMAAFVVCHSLQDQPRNAWGNVLLLRDFDAREVKCDGAG